MSASEALHGVCKVLRSGSQLLTSCRRPSTSWSPYAPPPTTNPPRPVSGPLWSTVPLSNVAEGCGERRGHRAKSAWIFPAQNVRFEAGGYRDVVAMFIWSQNILRIDHYWKEYIFKIGANRAATPERWTPKEPAQKGVGGNAICLLASGSLTGMGTESGRRKRLLSAFQAGHFAPGAMR